MEQKGESRRRGAQFTAVEKLAPTGFAVFQGLGVPDENIGELTGRRSSLKQTKRSRRTILVRIRDGSGTYSVSPPFAEPKGAGWPNTPAGWPLKAEFVDANNSSRTAGARIRWFSTGGHGH